MLDSTLRPLIDPPLNAVARALDRCGISANALSLVGLLIGVAAGAAIASRAHDLGLVLVSGNRLLDGLDGALAWLQGRTDFGGYLDIYADFVVYGAVLAGFALAEPANALPAALLLACFMVSRVSFLGYAIVAARRGMVTVYRGEKSFYHVAGLAEGSETIAAFVFATLKPSWFPQIACAFKALCVLTAFARLSSG